MIPCPVEKELSDMTFNKLRLGKLIEIDLLRQ